MKPLQCAGFAKDHFEFKFEVGDFIDWLEEKIKTNGSFDNREYNHLLGFRSNHFSSLLLDLPRASALLDANIYDHIKAEYEW